MGVDAEFVAFVAANVGYWLGVSAEISDETLPELAVEIENLAQAIEFALPLLPTDAARLTDRLFPLFEHYGHWQLGLQLTEPCLAVEEPLLRASLHNNLGVYARSLGALEQAVTAHRQAADLFARADERRQYALTHGYLAACHFRAHRYEQAVEAATLAIEQLQVASADDVGWAFAHDMLGSTQAALGDYPAAVRHYQAAIDGWERTQKHSYRCRSLSNLGLTHAAHADYADALRCYDAALSLANAQQNQLDIIPVLINKGFLFCDLETYAEAEAMFRRALRLLVNYPTALRLQAVAQNNLGYIFNLTGQYVEAQIWLELAADNWRLLQDPMYHANTLGELGKCQRGLGQVEQADHYLRRAIDLLSQFTTNQWAVQSADELRHFLADMHGEGESP